MKITDIKIYTLDAFRTNWAFIKVETDEGLYGWGEATLGTQEMSLEGCISDYKRLIVGRDPLEVERMLFEVYRDSYWKGGPVMMSALAGIEIACWDIAGKFHDVPVHALLGGKMRDRVKMYANAWFVGAREPEEFAAAAKIRNGEIPSEGKSAREEFAVRRFDSPEAVHAFIEEAVKAGEIDFDQDLVLSPRNGEGEEPAAATVKSLNTGIQAIENPHEDGMKFAPEDRVMCTKNFPKLDIWNWDALLTPPMQKVQASRITRRTYPVVIDLATSRPVLLSENDFESLTYIQGGDGTWAFAEDDSPYRLSSYWDSNNFNDIRLVSLRDGSRKDVAVKLPGSARISPEGKYVIWYNYDDSQWYTYDIATQEEVCLTADSRVNFYDEEDDHPSPAGPYDRNPVWTAGDEYVLICDRYDVWKFKADGSKVECLTKGVGRQNRIRFGKTSYVDYGWSANDRRLGATVVPTETGQFWLSAFDEVSKQNGLAMVTGLKPQEPVWFVEPSSFGTVVIARNAPVVAFTKGDFRHPYNLYLAYDATKKGLSTKPFSLKPSLQKRVDAATCLTDINKQQADYRWGDARLVHWTAYDGTPLDGILIVPEDLKPGEKIPMMIYFYERNSETLYNYRQPAPSRSTVNPAMYVSNGYAFFIPDIVYKDGHPGESAYNCICSGAEAMCEQFGFIDKDRMAIQGQSWGGYQTAYLITRTDMFAAAGAGAPVGNMTSAYGGIRWESGLVRAMQYEHGQSRIGKSIWEEGGLELYIENSPIFHVDKVNTPVLIMANDADGAVPWYQGIEFFSDLRRFSKPAWMLTYNDEAHNLVERRNSKDLSRRLQQFFDHYLKGAPMPVWMKYGVPTHRKGQEFGFEYAE